MVYCTYNMLNIFRALLCPSSGARDYMCVITAYGVRCLGCWLLEVRYRTAGYAFGMRDVARLSRLSSSSSSSSSSNGSISSSSSSNLNLKFSST